VPGRGAVELLVELGDNRAAAHLVEVVVGGGDFFAGGVGAVDVDRDEVTVDRRPLDLDELAVVVAQAVDLCVELLVGHARCGHGHDQPVVAGSEMSGRTCTVASNATGPLSSPEVMSISGGAIGSTSVSTTARA